jgi:hypothetical protein
MMICIYTLPRRLSLPGSLLCDVLVDLVAAPDAGGGFNRVAADADADADADGLLRAGGGAEAPGDTIASKIQYFPGSGVQHAGSKGLFL